MTILALNVSAWIRRDGITIRSTGDQPATTKALRTGTTDAALLPSGQSESFICDGYPALLDMSTVEVYGPQLLLVTTGQYLRDHERVVSEVLYALIESAAFMWAPSNEESFETEFANAFGVTTPAALQTAYQDLKNLNRRPFPSAGALGCHLTPDDRRPA